MFSSSILNQMIKSAICFVIRYLKTKFYKLNLYIDIE